LAVKWWVNNEQIPDPLFYQDTTINFPNPGKFNVKLEVDYGKCKVQTIKEIIVHQSPRQPLPVSKRTVEGCGIPATFQFTDTTDGAVEWVWYDVFRRDTLSKQKSFNHTFNDGGSSSLRVWVTNSFGCKTEGFSGAYFPVTSVSVGTVGGDLVKCTKDSMQFFASPIPYDDSVVSFKWNFGDGKGTSSAKSPKYAYDKAGRFTITLEYQTQSGCKGTATTTPDIEEIPEVDFFAPGGTTICGSSPVNIKPRDYVHGYYTYFVDNKYYYASYFSGITNLIFNEKGKYDVVLYYSNQHCFDTIVKKDYLTVLPPFPKIHEVINTCDGDRGLVTFIDSSRDVEKWKWDFGDGTTREYNEPKDTIQHHYKKTGSFGVVLETTYGPCTLKENNWASVLLKQDPEISSPLPIACADKNIITLIGPLERNPQSVYNLKGYNVWGIEYKDSTIIDLEDFYSRISFDPINGYVEYPFIKPSIGKFNFRYIIKSGYFNCFDTTNYLKIELKGPAPNLQIFPDSLCIRENLAILDRSKPYTGSLNKSWQWMVGDYSYVYLDTTQFTSGNLNFSLKNAKPGELYVDLYVTDNEGCVSYESKSITVSGPKSSFNVSSRIVALNSTVSFTNTTDYSTDYDVTFKWILPDNVESYSENESFTFEEEGFYTVKLININNETGCSDTAVSTIEVRKVNAQFTHSISYVNNNGCPPAIVRFTSTATNASRYGWNFGNGATGGNQTSVTHTYNQPGIFQVWHYSYDENNNVDSSFDFIEIKGPYALISADRLSACNNLQVTLTAEVKMQIVIPGIWGMAPSVLQPINKLPINT
jgi:PKD repeat protein